ncbi:MAG: 2-dehydro-3-deoxy-6-phosphogalactonate aldolase [Burkholderiaceae bacterium]
MRIFDEAFAQLPLVAILRGVQPGEVAGIVAALIDAGFTLIEIPLNSPDPLRSLSLAVQAGGGQAGRPVLIGAGTVLDAEQARAVLGTGARMIVAPNWQPDVGEVARAGEAAWIPGVMTPTEAFGALAAGADALKLFPAEVIQPAGLKAMRAVLPVGTRLLPVGGIDTGSLAAWIGAGATGFGLGSALYKPGDSAARVGQRARGFVAAWRENT